MVFSMMNCFYEQVPGDSPDGCRPQQYRQVSEVDGRSRAVSYLPDPTRIKGQMQLNFVFKQLLKGCFV